VLLPFRCLTNCRARRNTRQRRSADNWVLLISYAVLMHFASRSSCVRAPGGRRWSAQRWSHLVVRRTADVCETGHRAIPRSLSFCPRRSVDFTHGRFRITDEWQHFSSCNDGQPATDHFQALDRGSSFFAPVGGNTRASSLSAFDRRRFSGPADKAPHRPPIGRKPRCQPK
jgi:hypothetical protein